MISNCQDTIVAVATAAGAAGVGVVRLSGKNVNEYMNAILGGILRPREACYRKFLGGSGECLDSGVAIYFSTPKSFTGEDVLELQGHGGRVVLNQVVERCIELGARRARPGEFSERAFLNGKLDLAEAEAVSDLINASSEQAAKSAVRSMQGEFSREIHKIQDLLKDLRVYVEAAIDFPEEEIDYLADPQVLDTVEKILAELNCLIDLAEQGILLKEGVTVVLVGRPNAGKSSLLNCLLGVDEAIVADEAGTTRDVLRYSVSIQGVPVQLIDTAGLHDTKSLVEKEGIRRAWSEIETADHIVFVQDASTSYELNIESVWPEFVIRYPQSKQLVTLVLNKIDLTNYDVGEVPNSQTTIAISAKYRLGIELLIDKLLYAVGCQNLGEGIFSARARHIAALKSARSTIHAGKEQLTFSGSGELLAEDLRQAHNKLSEITGSFTPDDLLGEIFASFCIGK